MTRSGCILAGAALYLTAAGAAHAACEFTIEVGDTMEYKVEGTVVKEMVVEKSCPEVSVTLNHTGNLPEVAMGHNWVIAETADMQGVATDGMAAGLDNDYIKPGDERVLAATEVIGGGESTTMSFSTDALKAGGDYKFFCSFPGHYTVMQGDLVVK